MGDDVGEVVDLTLDFAEGLVGGDEGLAGVAELLAGLGLAGGFVGLIFLLLGLGLADLPRAQGFRDLIEGGFGEAGLGAKGDVGAGDFEDGDVGAEMAVDDKSEGRVGSQEEEG